MKTLPRTSLVKISLLALVALLILAACTTQPDVTSLSPQQQAANFSPMSTRNLELGQALFTGKISKIASDSVTVDQVVFRTDAQTLRSASLVVGNSVNVKALVLPDQTRYALEINPVAEDSSSSSSLSSLGTVEFKLYGVVEAMADASWTISGNTIVVDASTPIESGLVVGSIVEVEGWVVNGSLVAREIKSEDSLDDGFELTETPEMEISETPEFEISETPEAEITLTSPAAVGTEIEFFETVASINGNTWLIGNRTVLVNSITEIKDNVGVGSYVKVHATPQTDGTYLAREIESGLDN